MQHPDAPNKPVDAHEWAQRRANNKRLGYLFAAIAVAIFLGSIWKYRPF